MFANTKYLALTKNRDKVIFPLSYEQVKQIDLKDNTLKNISLGSNIGEPIYIVEDDNNDFYFASTYIVYKTDSKLKVIKSKQVDYGSLETDPNTINDKIENLSVPYFINRELDIFKYKPNNIISTNSNPVNIIKIDNKFLLLNGNYFQIVDSLPDQ